MPRGIYKRTKEHKRKIGESQTGEKNHNFGRHWTEEEKIRMGKGRVVTQQTRDKLRAARLGTTASKETLEKLRLKQLKQSKDPSYMKKVSDGVRKALAENPDITRRQSEFSKTRWQDPEYKSRVSATHLKRWEKNELARERLVERNVGGFWYGNVRYGEGPQYCELWTENLRERCRAYFNYTCVECGNRQNGRKLSVHHIHYNRKLCCDGSPRDLVALCPDCHPVTNHNRKYWEQHFNDIIQNYYLGKSFFTKEEYAAYKNGI